VVLRSSRCLGPTPLRLNLLTRFAEQEMDNPDVRDRGFIYWRLLSASPEKAQQIVLAQRPTVVDDTNRTEPALLADLISNLASLTSVYHRRPNTFVDRRRTKAPIEAVERDDDGAQVGYSNFSEQYVSEFPRFSAGDTRRLQIKFRFERV